MGRGQHTEPTPSLLFGRRPRGVGPQPIPAPPLNAATLLLQYEETLEQAIDLLSQVAAKSLIIGVDEAKRAAQPAIRVLSQLAELIGLEGAFSTGTETRSWGWGVNVGWQLDSESDPIVINGDCQAYELAGQLIALRIGSTRISA